MSQRKGLGQNPMPDPALGGGTRMSAHPMLLPRIGSVVILALALGLTACAATHQHACTTGEQSALHDSLFFGTAKTNGVVTQEEWTEFLRSVVTPRFPQGLTVWKASGQWRSSDGSILREASHVLNLVHPNDEPTEKAVLEIVAAYKSRFQQESVLRVKAPACASF